MSKDDTATLKGIAILMMLFLHLFAKQGTIGLYTPLITINGVPFAAIFARACNPVPFFLVCSGYGLAYVYHHRRLGLRSQGRRLLKLYLNYWLILAIFVTIGSFVKPDRFPGSIGTFIENFTGWNTDGYDHPAWFLLPYAILSLTSPWIFRAMDKLGLAWSLAVSCFLCYVSMTITSLYIAPGGHQHEWYSIVISYFGLLFYFVLGAFLNYRLGGGTEQYKRQIPSKYAVSLLVCWLVIHFFTGSAAFNPFFVAAFMFIFLNLKISGYLRRVLVELGKKSMPMWLIHAFYYTYLCPDFIYGFKYPLLIFFVLVVISYLSAKVILQISKSTINKIV